MKLLSNPEESLYSEEEKDVVAMEIDDDKGKEDEEEEGSFISSGEEDDAEEEEDGGREAKNEQQTIPVPFFGDTYDQYALYAFCIFCCYYYLTIGRAFRPDSDDDVNALSEAQADEVSIIFDLAGHCYNRTRTISSRFTQAMVQRCESRGNVKGAELFQRIHDAAYMQKTKLAEERKCVISGKPATTMLNIVTKLDADEAITHAKSKVEFSGQYPVSDDWKAVCQLSYLLANVTHYLNTEIPKMCGDLAVPMKKGALQYIEKELIDCPLQEFIVSKGRLVIKKSKTAKYVGTRDKKKSRPLTILAMEVTQRIVILIHGVKFILDSDKLSV